MRSDGPAYCQRCGYDLRGITTPVCTECGADLRRVGVATTPRKRRDLLARSFVFLLLYLIVASAVNALVEPMLPVAAKTKLTLDGSRLLGENTVAVDADITMTARERWLSPGHSLSADIGLVFSRSGKGPGEQDLVLASTDAPTLHWDGGATAEADGDLAKTFEKLGLDRERAEQWADDLERQIAWELRKKSGDLTSQLRKQIAMPMMQQSTGQAFGASEDAWRMYPPMGGFVVTPANSWETAWHALLLLGGGAGLLIILAGFDLRPKRWQQRTGHYD